MTLQEFQSQYKRLSDVHSSAFSSQEKMATIWEHVKELDADWFRRITDQIVMSNNPYQEKFDIGYAARAERIAIKSKQFADDVSEATKNWEGITKQGLENSLNAYKSNSLWEAITKSRSGDL